MSVKLCASPADANICVAPPMGIDGEVDTRDLSPEPPAPPQVPSVEEGQGLASFPEPPIYAAILMPPKKPPSPPPTSEQWKSARIDGLYQTVGNFAGMGVGFLVGNLPGMAVGGVIGAGLGQLASHAHQGEEVDLAQVGIALASAALGQGLGFVSAKVVAPLIVTSGGARIAQLVLEHLQTGLGRRFAGEVAEVELRALADLLKLSAPIKRALDSVRIASPAGADAAKQALLEAVEKFIARLRPYLQPTAGGDLLYTGPTSLLSEMFTEAFTEIPVFTKFTGVPMAFLSSFNAAMFNAHASPSQETAGAVHRPF